MTAQTEASQTYTAHDGLTYNVGSIAVAYVRKHAVSGARRAVACVECDFRPVMIDSLASETDARLLAELMIHADRDHTHPAKLTVTTYVNPMRLF